MVPSLLLRVASSGVLDAYSRVLNGTRLARPFARGTRAAVQVIGAQLKALRCGWTAVDFVGEVRATNAAPSRANLRVTAAPWLVLRLSRGSLALLPVSASCTDSPAVFVRCLGLLIRPLSVASLRCRTPTLPLRSTCLPSPRFRFNPPFVDTPPPNLLHRAKP